MKLFKISPDLTRLDESIAHQVVDILRSGGIIAYPTDTLYGLGVDASSDEAVNSLYALKGRQNAPVSVLVESVESLMAITKNISEDGMKIIRAFLPGPVTLICETDYHFSPVIRSEKGTVGFRIPDHKIARHLPALFGKPVTTTSANISGHSPARSVEKIVGYFDKRIDIILDAGEIPPSKGSTVIDISVTPFRILREGEVTAEEIKRTIS